MRGSSPERAIQPTCKLGRITHESTSVAKTSVDQAALNSLNPAVHHIARCDAVRACAGVVEGNLGDAFYGGFSIDRTVRVQETAVTV